MESTLYVIVRVCASSLASVPLSVSCWGWFPPQQHHFNVASCCTQNIVRKFKMLILHRPTAHGSRRGRRNFVFAFGHVFWTKSLLYVSAMHHKLDMQNQTHAEHTGTLRTTLDKWPGAPTSWWQMNRSGRQMIVTQIGRSTRTRFDATRWQFCACVQDNILLFSQAWGAWLGEGGSASVTWPQGEV